MHQPLKYFKYAIIEICILKYLLCITHMYVYVYKAVATNNLQRKINLTFVTRCCKQNFVICKTL